MDDYQPDPNREHQFCASNRCQAKTGAHSNTENPFCRLVFTCVAWLVLLNLIVVKAHASSCGSGEEQVLWDRTYCLVSQEVSRPARWLDGVFAEGEESSAYGQITFVTGPYWDELDGTSWNNHFYGHWVLPNLQEKVQIRFSGQQQVTSGEEGQPNQDTLTLGEASSGASLVARLNRFNLTFGARWEDGLLWVTKLGFPNVWKSDQYRLGSLQRIRWDSRNGWGYLNQFYLDKYVSEQWAMGLDSSLSGDFSESLSEHTLTYYNQYHWGEWTHHWYLGVVNSSAWDWGLSDSWVSAGVSHRFYRDWARIELTPAVHWPRTQNHEPVRQISLHWIVRFGT